MRRTFLISAVITSLLLVSAPQAGAQVVPMPGQGYPTAYSAVAGAQAPGSQFGYYVPVFVNDDGSITPANHTANLSDSPEWQTPEVTEGPDDCGCAACDARYQRGCESNCQCLRCQHGRLHLPSFGSLEYMFWYNKGSNLPPLVTSNAAGIPPLADAGVLGLPGTSIVFGNGAIDDDLQSGGRLTFGWWLDDYRHLAVGAKFFGVEGGVVNYSATSTGDPVLGRPFYNSSPLVAGQDALLVAYPGLTSGSVGISAANDVLGAEVFGRSLLDACEDYRLDLVGGYQFARIDSDLIMLSQHDAAGANFTFADLFEVDNQYHGGFGGLYGEKYNGCFTFSALAKIGLGNMRQKVNIQGFNTIRAGGTVTTPGGLYTQPTNIGVHRQNVLTWSPEANFKLSYAVTPQLSLSVGYTFLYYTRVAFAGDQIDTSINATQLSGGALVGPAQPTFAFRDTDFWVQSVDLGVVWEF